MAKQTYKAVFAYPDFESLGVEYLMSLMHKSRHDAELVYYEAENSYLARSEKKVPYSKIARKIASKKPDIACFSCVTDNYRYQLKIARAVKKIDPSIATIFGGIHVTAVPKVVLAENAVDAIAIGEAEVSFIEFIKNCKKTNGKFSYPDKKIKGIVYKRGRRRVGDFKEGNLMDLNKLPFPHKEPFIASLAELKKRYNIMTSRGCPYSCTYCFHSTICAMRGKKIIRQRSVRNVIGELLWAKKNFDFDVVYFCDDSFTTDRKWVLRFLKEYKKKVRLPFGCASHPSCMDRKLAKKLASAGCIFGQMGIQSLEPELSWQVLGRAVNRKKTAESIKHLKDAGMMVQVDHMFGIPGDTLENQVDAARFYNEHRPHLVSIFWLTYYPNTPIVNTALKYKAITKNDSKKIEKGLKITKGTLHDGGSMKNPKPFYSVQFLINYLPFLPKFVVQVLLDTGLYKIFSIRNYYLSTAIPRALRSMIDSRYFWGRNLLVSFVQK